MKLLKSSLLSRWLSSSPRSSKSFRTEASTRTEDISIECDQLRAELVLGSSSSSSPVPDEVNVASWEQDQEEDDSENYWNDDDEGDAHEQPSTCLERAAVHLEHDRLEEALQEIEQGLVEETCTEELRSLFQLKAEVLTRTGHFDESLALYQQVLDDAATPQADQANTAFVCGRLCERCHDFKGAVKYYRRELLLTRHLVASTVEAPPLLRLSLSRIHHSLAAVYRDGFGDGRQALFEYQKALTMEMGVLRECLATLSTACLCTDQGCAHRAEVAAARQQVADTKRAMGRIYFELGDLERAMRLSL